MPARGSREREPARRTDLAAPVLRSAHRGRSTRRAAVLRLPVSAPASRPDLVPGRRLAPSGLSRQGALRDLVPHREGSGADHVGRPGMGQPG
ncbi:hypothetical protein FW320_13090 [Azospirillum sp. Vi22]|nr:hypothetical protein [Azospirillum baldaniorum]